MIPTKAYVLRDSTASKIMAFRHPSAGIQLVKGTIEPGERPARVTEISGIPAYNSGMPVPGNEEDVRRRDQNTLVEVSVINGTTTIKSWRNPGVAHSIGTTRR
jgi:hypothetical protein